MSPCAKFVDLDSTTSATIPPASTSPFELNEVLSATIPPESTSFNSNGGIYDFTSFILPLIYGSTDKYSVRINTSESLGSGIDVSLNSKSASVGNPTGRFTK